MLGGEGALRLTQSLRGVSQKTIHFPIIWKTFGIITCMLHKIENCSHAHHFPCSPNQCHHWANILGIKIGARRSLYKIGLQHCCRNNILIRWDGTFSVATASPVLFTALEIRFHSFERLWMPTKRCSWVWSDTVYSVEFSWVPPNQKCFPSKGDFPNIRFRDGRMAGGESLNWISKPWNWIQGIFFYICHILFYNNILLRQGEARTTFARYEAIFGATLEDQQSALFTLSSQVDVVYGADAGK